MVELCVSCMLCLHACWHSPPGIHPESFPAKWTVAGVSSKAHVLSVEVLVEVSLTFFCLKTVSVGPDFWNCYSTGVSVCQIFRKLCGLRFPVGLKLWIVYRKGPRRFGIWEISIYVWQRHILFAPFSMSTYLKMGHQMCEWWKAPSIWFDAWWSTRKTIYFLFCVFTYVFLDFPMALTCHHVLMHVVFHKDVFSLGHLKVDAALCRYAPSLAHWSIDKVWRKGRAIIALIATVCTFFCSINLLDPESILF